MNQFGQLKSSGKKVEVSVNLLFIHLENIIVTDMQMHTFIAATSKKIYINPTISPRKLHLLTFVVVRDVSRHALKPEQLTKLLPNQKLNKFLKHQRHLPKFKNQKKYQIPLKK